ncbi:MAG: 23S rRNA (uracil(1939)-C(5))-methyltransferase RlmD [Bacteroidaceae bacterium]|nr:23S rRNA (uracil(1939)-C(5))-methyltransferase RlmD [Bacteroidaceae bacterium]
MARTKKPLPLLEGIEITDYAAEGKSLARIMYGNSNIDENGVQHPLVLFVPWTVPGDIVDVQVRRKKNSFIEGEAVRFVKYSERRRQPKCQHFGICGGCKWQMIPYEEQLRMKHKQVSDQLHRIGKIELPEILPVLGSVKEFEYRNKVEFSCSNKRWLTMEEVRTGVKYDNMNAVGFHITGAFDKIYPIEKCYLMDDLQNRLRNFIRDYANENGVSFFDVRAQQGLLRDMMIRNSNSGEWMLLVQFNQKEEKDFSETVPNLCAKGEALLAAIHQNFPEITSLLWVDNQKCNDTFGDLPVNVYYGNDHIFELMEELRFKVGPKSFYQTNTEQALELYKVARSFAELTGAELVYDLYTGTGTIANFVAGRAKHVIGIEYVPEAIEDAKINSEINNVQNTEFYAGDMKDILTDDFVKQHGQPDVIITDPPRAGMHQDVINVILNAKPQRIVYVSCNPATQARDLQLLDADYKVTKVQPVDMFPHTPHVENVVQLVRRRKAFAI